MFDGNRVILIAVVVVILSLGLVLSSDWLANHGGRHVTGTLFCQHPAPNEGILNANLGDGYKISQVFVSYYEYKYTEYSAFELLFSGNDVLEQYKLKLRAVTVAQLDSETSSEVKALASPWVVADGNNVYCPNQELQARLGKFGQIALYSVLVVFFLAFVIFCYAMLVS